MLTTILGYAGALLGLGGAVAGVIYYIKRALSNQVALEQRDAALQVESDHVAAQQAADAKQRTERAAELDGKLAQIHDTAGADALLRDVTGAGPT